MSSIFAPTSSSSWRTFFIAWSACAAASPSPMSFLSVEWMV